MMLATFRRYVSDPTTTETELHERAGQRVAVLGEIDPSTYDRDEVGTMYRIQFIKDQSRATYEAFSEELSEWEAQSH